MCHSDKTAKQYYLRGELTEVADRGLDIIIECTPDPKSMLCVEAGDDQADHQVEGQAVPTGDEGDNPEWAGPTLDQGDEAEWTGPTSTQGTKEKPEGPGELQQCDLAKEDPPTK